MNQSQNPIFWSFPMGSLFATRIRVSWFFPLLALIFLFKFEPHYNLALALTAIIFVSALMHELLGHVLVARSTGGDGDEVLIWPLGGLAWVHPANTFTSQFLTAAGGPAINLLICLSTLPTVIMIPDGYRAMNPFELPIAGFSSSWGTECLLLIFFVNWAMALISLLPIYPLDGGRMVEACLVDYWSGYQRKSICLKIGLFITFVLFAVGIVIDHLWVVVLSSMLLTLSMLEWVSIQLGDSYDDSFFGYDFSQGYTSLEKSESTKSRKSFWRRWVEQRQEKKEIQEMQKQEDEEKKLDELLEKVHSEGMSALSPSERKFLNRTSQKYRTK